MITTHNVEQGSEQWHKLRRGTLTASEVKKILTEKTLKIANNNETRSHVYEIAAQRVTGYTEPQYISDDMLRGMQDEIFALELYAEKYAPVTEVGFITNDDLGFTIGYSPDALVGDDGLIEIKSRCQKYQFQTIAGGEVPSEYMLQIQTGLLVAGRKWLDFISYCAGMPMFVKRVEPIEEYQVAIKEAASDFYSKVDEQIAIYNKNSESLHKTERRDGDLDLV